MVTIRVQYLEEGSKKFYRFYSNNGDRVREVAIRGRDIHRCDRSLFFALRDFYPGREVELEFLGSFPSDRREVLEELVVVHNNSIRNL